MSEVELVQEAASVTGAGEIYWTLNKFEVYIDSGSEQLFANGRQQVKVRVIVQAVQQGPNGFEAYLLPEFDLQCIWPIFYDKVGGKIVDVPFRENNEPLLGWAWTWEKNPLYRYFNSTQLPLDGATLNGAGLTAGDQYRDFWIDTTELEQVKIGAKVTRFILLEEPTVFATNDENYLNGYVTLRPVAVPAYSLGNLTYEQTSYEGDSESPFGWDCVDYCSFSMNPLSAGGGFISVQTPPRGIFKFDVSPANRGSCIGWVNVGETAISYSGNNRPYSPIPVPTSSYDGYPAVGRGLLVMVMRNELGNPAGATEAPDSITMRDFYGNDYTIRFTFKKDLKAAGNKNSESVDDKEPKKYSRSRIEFL